MYVSGYNEIVDELIKKFDDESDDAPARKLQDRVQKFFKKATDDAYQALFDDVQDWLLSNMGDAIRDAARRLAEQYVKSALAGDQKTFGDMFNFQHDWKGLHCFDGTSLPLGIALRRQLLTKNHDLFESKIITDLEGELAALKRMNKLIGWRQMVEGDL